MSGSVSLLPGAVFANVDEIYLFRVRDGKLARAVGAEDNLSRLRQLGIRRKYVDAPG